MGREQILGGVNRTLIFSWAGIRTKAGVPRGLCRIPGREWANRTKPKGMFGVFTVLLSIKSQDIIKEKTKQIGTNLLEMLVEAEMHSTDFDLTYGQLLRRERYRNTRTASCVLI